MQMSPPTLYRRCSDDTATSESDDSSPDIDYSELEYASQVHLAVPRHSATMYDVRMPPPARASHRHQVEAEVHRATASSFRSNTKPKRDSYGPRSPVHAEVRSRRSSLAAWPLQTAVATPITRREALAAGTKHFPMHSSQPKHSRNHALSLKSSTSFQGLRNLLTGRRNSVEDELASLAGRPVSGDQLIIVQ
jgi:hypothetical protein